MRYHVRGSGSLLVLLVFGGCASHPAVTTVAPPAPVGSEADAHVPDYAKRPDEPFSRVNAVAIAQREWRACGSVVNDAPPGPDLPLDLRLDRQPGLWQRVGDYWWFGQDALTKAERLDRALQRVRHAVPGEPPAWSAAFISYIMRAAGAGERFPYSPLHSEYINAAARGNSRSCKRNRPNHLPAAARRPHLLRPRRAPQRLRFEDLPAPSFLGHCDIVVDAQPGVLSVIGGNVSAGVTMKHIPVTDSGTLAEPTAASSTTATRGSSSCACSTTRR